MHDRHDLTDEQWALLEPHLPSRVPRRGRPWRDHRQVVNGILWRTRTGSPWRDVPAAYGPWATVYGRHRDWSGDGTWERALAELQRGSDTEFEEWTVGVDSTVIRAHSDAAGAPKIAPADVPAHRLAVTLEDFVSARAKSSPPGVKGQSASAHEAESVSTSGHCHTGGSIELQEFRRSTRTRDRTRG